MGRWWIGAGVAVLLVLAWGGWSAWTALDAARRTGTAVTQDERPAPEPTPAKGTGSARNALGLPSRKLQGGPVLTLRTPIAPAPADPAAALASWDEAVTAFRAEAARAVSVAALVEQDADAVLDAANAAVASVEQTWRPGLAAGSRRGGEARDALRRAWNRFVAEAPSLVEDEAGKAALGQALASAPSPVGRRAATP